MSHFAWRDFILSSVPGAKREPGQPSLVSFISSELVTLLFQSKRCASRAEAINLCESLRARDVFRPMQPSSAVSNGIKFTDSRSVRWVCRADEPVSQVHSFSVAAIFNSSNYVLAAPFMKQGAFFLNRRFFLLDRATCRLYVYTDDASSSPRYYADFSTAVDASYSSQAVVAYKVRLLAPDGASVELMDPSLSSFAMNGSKGKQHGSRNSFTDYVEDADTDTEDDGLNDDDDDDDNNKDDNNNNDVNSSNNPSNKKIANSARNAIGDETSVEGEVAVSSTPSSFKRRLQTANKGLNSNGASSSTGATNASITSNSSLTASSWLPNGTLGPLIDTAPTGGRGRAWGFVLTGPSNLRIEAFSSTERRARVWVRAIEAAIALRAPQPILSHSQQRLRAYASTTIPLPRVSIVAANNTSSLLSRTSSVRLPPSSSTLPSSSSSSSLASNVGRNETDLSTDDLSSNAAEKQTTKQDGGSLSNSSSVVVFPPRLPQSSTFGNSSRFSLPSSSSSSSSSSRDLNTQQDDPITTRDNRINNERNQDGDKNAAKKETIREDDEQHQNPETLLRFAESLRIAERVANASDLLSVPHAVLRTIVPRMWAASHAEACLQLSFESMEFAAALRQKQDEKEEQNGFVDEDTDEISSASMTSSSSTPIPALFQWARVREMSIDDDDIYLDQWQQRESFRVAIGGSDIAPIVPTSLSSTKGKNASSRVGVGASSMSSLTVSGVLAHEFGLSLGAGNGAGESRSGSNIDSDVTTDRCLADPALMMALYSPLLDVYCESLNSSINGAELLLSHQQQQSSTYLSSSSTSLPLAHTREKSSSFAASSSTTTPSKSSSNHLVDDYRDQSAGGDVALSNNSDNNSLRPLQLLVLQPRRLETDLGIFIPSHQRYILERCASLVPPFITEEDEEEERKNEEDIDSDEDEDETQESTNATVTIKRESSNTISATTATTSSSMMPLSEKSSLQSTLRALYKLVFGVSPSAAVDLSEPYPIAAVITKRLKEANLLEEEDENDEDDIYDASGGISSQSSFDNNYDDDDNNGGMKDREGKCSEQFLSRRSLLQLQVASALSAHASITGVSGGGGGGRGGDSLYSPSLASGDRVYSARGGQNSFSNNKSSYNNKAPSTNSGFNNGRVINTGNDNNDGVIETMIMTSLHHPSKNASIANALQLINNEAIEEEERAMRMIPRVPASVGNGKIAFVRKGDKLMRADSSDKNDEQEGEGGGEYEGQDKSGEERGKRNYSQQGGNGKGLSSPSSSSSSSISSPPAWTSLSPMESESWAIELFRCAATVHSALSTTPVPFLPSTQPASTVDSFDPVTSSSSSSSSSSLSSHSPRTSSAGITSRSAGSDLASAFDHFSHSAHTSRRRASSGDQYVYGLSEGGGDMLKMSSGITSLPSTLASQNTPPFGPTSAQAKTLTAAAQAAASSSNNSHGGSSAILAKVVDLSSVHLKTMMVKRAVDCLRSGASPVSVILQRVISLFSSVYCKETISVSWRAKHYDVPGAVSSLREFNAPCASAAAQLLRADLQPTLVRMAKLLSEWPRNWLSSLTDWGTTGLYLKPSRGFLAECGVTQYGPKNESISQPQQSFSSSDSLWKYCCKVAKSVHFTERDIDDICIDAIQTVVFEGFGESVSDLYQIANKAEDDALLQVYDALWGISSSQLDLAKELRLDACTQISPSFPHASTRGGAVLSASQKPMRMKSIWYEIDSSSSTSSSMSSSSTSGGSTSFPPPSICLPPKPHQALRVNVLIPLRRVTRGAETQYGILGWIPTSSLLLNENITPLPTSPLSTASGSGTGSGKQQSSKQTSLFSLVTASSPSKSKSSTSSSSSSSSMDDLVMSFPDFSGGTLSRPAALSAFQPAISTFSFIASAVEPNLRLKVLVATVDALCRCASAHRGGVALSKSIQHNRNQMQINQSMNRSSAHGSSIDSSSSSSSVVDPASVPQPLSNALIETAHINADDLLGLLCLVLIHARVPKLASRVAMAADYVSEVMLIERPGFFLTSLQAAISYALSDDIKQRLACGVCEKASAPIHMSCAICGRRLCATCDASVHGKESTHRRKVYRA
jgi:hypothetical protein